MSTPELIIQIVSTIETATGKTIFVFLTNEGRVYQSYDLEKWELTRLPDFTVNTVKEKVTKLNG